MAAFRQRPSGGPGSYAPNEKAPRQTDGTWLEEWKAQRMRGCCKHLLPFGFRGAMAVTRRYLGCVVSSSGGRNIKPNASGGLFQVAVAPSRNLASKQKFGPRRPISDLMSPGRLARVPAVPLAGWLVRSALCPGEKVGRPNFVWSACSVALGSSFSTFCNSRFERSANRGKKRIHSSRGAELVNHPIHSQFIAPSKKYFRLLIPRSLRVLRCADCGSGFCHLSVIDLKTDTSLHKGGIDENNRVGVKLIDTSQGACACVFDPCWTF